MTFSQISEYSSFKLKFSLPVKNSFKNKKLNFFFKTDNYILKQTWEDIFNKQYEKKKSLNLKQKFILDLK